MLISLEEAKEYLRVDSYFEDAIISTLLASSEALCQDVARLSPEEWKAISDYATGESVTIRSEEKTESEVHQIQALLRVGVYYALGYLYEQRDKANHSDLVLTLRSMLFAVREGVI